MNSLKKNSLAEIEFSLSWESETAKHKEVYIAERLNLYRDLLPGPIYESLIGSSTGFKKTFHMAPGEAAPDREPQNVFSLKQSQFDRQFLTGEEIKPQVGRYYPKGLLKGVTGVFKDNMTPFRCVGVDSSKITADFNHPLAGKPVDIDINVKKTIEKPTDRGGTAIDWMEVVSQGPGMQVRANGTPTAFFTNGSLSRKDNKEDTIFYEKPRLVTHIDDKAQKTIGKLYGDLLKPGTRVLDLMSSWRSHVPQSLELEGLVGLGMNAEEMEQNPQLTEYVVHDVNKNPRLPFEDNSFDAVICTVSVEYMTQPFELFEETARVLKPGGLFINTFSNRWFPPKVINIWTELSEFERMGVVLEYFLQSKKYENLETFSTRGESRSPTDRHYPEILTADPVYAVWGQKANN